MQEARSAGTREAPLAPDTEEGELRRRVPRTAFPRAAGKAVVASALVAVGFAVWPAQVWQRPSSPEPAPRVEAFARELEAIRAEVADRQPADAATKAAVTRLAERIDAIAREIDAVRSRAPVIPAAPPATSPAPADVGVAGVTDRLYNVEARQSQAEAERVTVERQLLARLHDLEVRQGARERQDSSALGLLLDRVEQLERSRDVAEANRLTGQNAILARLTALESRLETVPAAPQP